MDREILINVLHNLREAKTEIRLAQFNLDDLRDQPGFQDIEGVSVILTEIAPRLQAAYEAIKEALQIPRITHVPDNLHPL